MQTNANRTISSLARGQHVECEKVILESLRDIYLLGGCSWGKVRTKGSVTFEQRLRQLNTLEKNREDATTVTFYRHRGESSGVGLVTSTHTQLLHVDSLTHSPTSPITGRVHALPDSCPVLRCSRLLSQSLSLYVRASICDVSVCHDVQPVSSSRNVNRNPVL